MRWLHPGPRPLLVRRWTAEIPGNAAHNAAFDPDEDVLYVGDGWGGVADASLRLHRLRLGDGHETASRRLRHQQARCIAFHDRSRLLVATDSRLFKLDRSSLEVLREWDRDLPRFSNRLLARGALLLMANWAAPSVHVFDLDRGRRRRRLVGPQIRMAETSGGILVGSGVQGWLAFLDPLTMKMARRFQTPRFTELAGSRKTGMAWLVVGRRPLLPTGGVEESYPTSELVVLHGSQRAGSVKLSGPCQALTVSDDMEQVWCLISERLDIERRPRRLEIVEARTGRHVATFDAPGDEQLCAVSPPRGLVLTALRHPRQPDGSWASTFYCHEVSNPYAGGGSSP